MNHQLFARSLAVFFITVLGICSTPAVGAAGHTRLTIGIPLGLPGYEPLPEGGMLIADPYKRAMTECVEKRLETRFQWVAFPTNRVLQMLGSDEVDMLYPMGFTDERSAAMQASRPTWNNPDVWLSLKPVVISNKEAHIASRMGSPQHTEYVSEGFVKVTAAYAYEDLPRLLDKKLVDAAIVPRSVYQEHRSSWPKGYIVTPGKSRNSGFYLNKADPKGLLSPLNTAIGRCLQSVSVK